MRLPILILISIGLSILAKAEDKPAAKVHVLTGDEKAAIYKALFEQQKAQNDLQVARQWLDGALKACGPGADVAQDDNSKDLKCVAKPEPDSTGDKHVGTK